MRNETNNISVFCTLGKTASCLHMTDARNQPDFTAECGGISLVSCFADSHPHSPMSPAKKTTQN